MRKLHVVGYAADLGGFILAARRGAKTGTFVLALDDELVAQVERARRGNDQIEAPAPAAARPRSSSALTPREIQARLRAGHSIEEVADEAGVGVDWVERFAAPVLAEQTAAVQRAGDAVLHTPRKGPSDRPLEASLRRNLAERGVMMAEDEFQQGWSARHLIDTDWLVSFRFRSRGRPMTAEWMLNVANGALTTRNRLGAELGYIEPGRRLTAAPVAEGLPDLPPPAPARRRVAGGQPAAKRMAVVKAAPARPGAAKSPAAKASGRKAAAGKSVRTGKTAAARKVAAAKAPVGEPVTRKVAAAKAPGGVRASLGASPGGKTSAPKSAEPGRPAGAHYARSEKPGPIPAPSPPVAPPEPPRLPLGDFDDTPDDGGIRFGNRD